MPDTATATTFAAVWIALWVGHQIGDHWTQTDHQAATKADPGWTGRLACARHVATYTCTVTFFLATTAAALDLPITWFGLIAGQLTSAITHYWADRRTTLARLAARLDLERFHRLGAPRAGHSDNPCLGTGEYALDQAWHHLWLWVAALVTVLPGGTT